ncbi:hypothetical protein QF030_000364 [Streptomyces rishiriensis]|uniref:Transferase n=1 Tax=Streptomyces rishiriensis TaxID=68264 RepID=A0ABU0NGH5_STRRH|nr:hypothetical protein [Streptomyces rishiriensis]
MRSGDSNGMNGSARVAGVTEQLRADVTVDEKGRFVIGVRSPQPGSSRPRLLLRQRPDKGEPPRPGRVVALEPAGRDEWRGVLETVPALEEGRWDAYLMGPSEENRIPLLPGLRDLRALVSGRRDGHSAPLAVRIPYVTKDGRLAVRAWLRDTHAEAGRIDVTGGLMTVEVRLFGTWLGDGASVSLSRQGPEAVVRQISLGTDKGQEFSFTIGHQELVAHDAGPEAGAAPVVWEVYVHPSVDAPGIRVARLLDDVADRKAVFVYPATALVGGYTARPYYTVDNDLAVEVTMQAGRPS